MIYFLLHDADLVRARIAPALAASWRNRNFRPLVDLATHLRRNFTAFGERYHLTADERPLVTELTADHAFDRRLWRHLAGELLLYAAADVPAMQTAAETLAALVAPNRRETIRQAHAGSRDLEFDGVPYRPGRAGINDISDVARLADELTRLDSADWTADSLVDADDPEEEFGFAVASLAALREMYSQARERNQVVICEEF